MQPVRLQKFLAEAGVASRRKCEDAIIAGLVAVNGQITRQLGTKVHPYEDVVTYDGRRVRTRRKITIALHKPPGYHCTRSDPEGRKVIGDLLPREWGHLYSVGRLDSDSEGLLFLTNDGDFAQAVSHPRHGARKTYHILVPGNFPRELVAKLGQGIVDRGQTLRPIRVKLLAASRSRSTLEIVLAEGKNREIRRMLSAVGFRVTRLMRVQIGPVKLGELPAGKWRTLTESEIKSLLPKV